MPRYTVCVIEKIEKWLTIEASDEDEAREIALQTYQSPEDGTPEKYDLQAYVEKIEALDN